MFDQSVTPDSQQENQVQDNSPESSQEEDWLVVGDRKFDKQAAEKKIVSADNHILTLEAELAELRKAQEQQTLAEKQREAQEAMQSQTHQPKDTPSSSTSETPGLSLDEVTSKVLEQVKRSLTSEHQEKAKQANMQQAAQMAQAKYGDSYLQKLEETGQELGMDKTAIASMASTSPQAFARLFGLESGKAPQRVPDSNSAAHRHQTQQQDDNPFRSTAKTVLTSKSARERNAAIKALLDNAKR